MLDFIKNIDIQIFSFINGFYSEVADRIFLILTATVFWIPMFGWIIFLIIKRYKNQAIGLLTCLVLFVFLNDQSCNLIKKTVQRQRPSQDIEMNGKIHLAQKQDGTYYVGGKYGFPSAHAANSVLFVIYCVCFLKPRKKYVIVLLCLWSLLMVYSRIYLGVHYPSDILAGFVVGSFWGIGLFYFYSLCISKRIT